MDSGLVLISDFGIPINQILDQIRFRFNVGLVYDAAQMTSDRKDLYKVDFVEVFQSFDPRKDIPLIVYNIPDLDFLVFLDTLSTFKVLLIDGNMYWRLRHWIKAGGTTKTFLEVSFSSDLRKLIEERADAVLDLAKVCKNTDPLEIPDITALLDRVLATFQIHSSKVRK